MKRTFQFLMAVCAFVVAFSSCTKEGQYLPKEKISQIVYTKSYTEAITGITVSSTEKEEWNWGGDLLNFIDYYNSTGTRYNTTLFRYDDQKRIVEIQDGDGSAKFDYDDNQIDEIELYDQFGHETGKIEFEHKGGKVVAINVKNYDFAQKGFNPLRFIFPESLAEMMMKNASKSSDTRYTLTWKGNNVKTVEAIGSTRSSANYTYDNKTNPFLGLYNVLVSQRGSLMFSTNNVVQMVYKDDNTNLTEDYSYSYDGNYPTRVSWVSTASGLIGNYKENHVKEYRY